MAESTLGTAKYIIDGDASPLFAKIEEAEKRLAALGQRMGVMAGGGAGPSASNVSAGTSATARGVGGNGNGQLITTGTLGNAGTAAFGGVGLGANPSAANVSIPGGGLQAAKESLWIAQARMSGGFSAAAARATELSSGYTDEQARHYSLQTRSLGLQMQERSQEQAAMMVELGGARRRARANWRWQEQLDEASGADADAQMMREMGYGGNTGGGIGNAAGMRAGRYGAPSRYRGNQQTIFGMPGHLGLIGAGYFAFRGVTEAARATVPFQMNSYYGAMGLQDAKLQLGMQQAMEYTTNPIGMLATAMDKIAPAPMETPAFRMATYQQALANRAGQLERPSQRTQTVATGRAAYYEAWAAGEQSMRDPFGRMRSESARTESSANAAAQDEIDAITRQMGNYSSASPEWAQLNEQKTGATERQGIIKRHQANLRAINDAYASQLESWEHQAQTITGIVGTSSVAGDTRAAALWQERLRYSREQNEFADNNKLLPLINAAHAANEVIINRQQDVLTAQAQATLSVTRGQIGGYQFGARRSAAQAVFGAATSGMTSNSEEYRRLMAVRDAEVARADAEENAYWKGVPYLNASSAAALARNSYAAASNQVWGQWASATANLDRSKPEAAKFGAQLDTQYWYANQQAMQNVWIGQEQARYGVMGASMAAGAMWNRNPVGAQAAGIASSTLQNVLGLQAMGRADLAKTAEQTGETQMATLRRDYLLSFRGESVNLRNWRVDNPRDSQDPNKVLQSIDENIKWMRTNLPTLVAN